jgi:hypothetical protein
VAWVGTVSAVVGAPFERDDVDDATRLAGGLRVADAVGDGVLLALFATDLLAGLGVFEVGIADSYRRDRMPQSL